MPNRSKADRSMNALDEEIRQLAGCDGLLDRSGGTCQGGSAAGV